MKKRILALLLTFVMVVSLVPTSVFAANTSGKGHEHIGSHVNAAAETKAASDGSTVLAFTSDVHYTGNTSIDTWIDNIETNFGQIDYMGFCGDMADGTGNSASTYWTHTNTVMGMIESKVTDTCYTTGNHEYGPGDYNYSTPTSSTNATVAGKFTVDAVPSNLPSGTNYQIYCIGSASSDQAYTNAQVTKLNNYFAGADCSKPVFVLSHYPLHSSGSRSTNNADAVITALNSAVDDGFTVIFLWGHNHTISDSHYSQIYSPGSSTFSNFKFYYAAAGCMKYNDSISGKGLVATISNNAKATGSTVELTVVGSDGKKLSSSNTTSTTITVNGSSSSGSTVVYTLTDTLEAGKEYLIATANSGNAYILSKESGSTSGSLKGYSVSVVDGKITLDDSITESNVVFSCILDTNYSSDANMTWLVMGSQSQSLYMANSTNLSLASAVNGKCWHYKADDNGTAKNLLWFFNGTDGDYGYTATGTQKYYLKYDSNGNFTKGTVANANTIKSENTQAIYLFVKGDGSSGTTPDDPPVGETVSITPTSSNSPEESITIAVGETLTINVTNGSTSSAYDFTATLSNSGVAQIDPASVNIAANSTGQFTVAGLTAGTVDITIQNNGSYSNRKGTIHLTVGDGGSTPSGETVNVTPSTSNPEESVTIAVGETVTLIVTNSSTRSAYDFAATLSKSGVAQVSPSSVNIAAGGTGQYTVTGLADGKVDITISNNNSSSERKATIHVTVGDGGSSSTEVKYELVNSLEDGGEYLIVSANSGSAYALKNPGTTGINIANSSYRTAVTIESGNYIMSDADDIVWTATASGSGFHLSNNGLFLEGKSGKTSVYSTLNNPDRSWAYSSSNQLQMPGGTQNGQTYTYTMRYNSGSSRFEGASSTSTNTYIVYLFKKAVPAVDPEGITVSPTTLNLTEGETETLTVTVTPANANKTVSWTSDNEAAVTVVNGVVTAVAAGTATITATTVNGKTATCTVTVTAAPTTTYVQTNVLVAGQKYLIVSGNSGDVLILTSEKNGTATNSKQLKAISATVSADGKITIKDSVVIKSLFTAETNTNSAQGGFWLKNGDEYLYSANTEGLSMTTSSTLSSDSNKTKSWHYKADDKHLLWFFKDTDSQDGYTDTSQTYRYYLNYSSGTYFTDAHVGSNQSLSTTTTPEIYLFVEDTSHTHTYGDPSYVWATDNSSCTATVTCSGCDENTEGYTVTETVTASYAVTTEPSCSAVGEGTYTAAFTNTTYFTTQTQTVSIAKIAHTVVTDEAVAPTCTQTGLTEGSHCSVCNEVIVAQEVVAALGHDLEAHEAHPATCTEAGNNAYWSCKREGCGKYFSDAAGEHEIAADSWVINATGHNWTVTWEWAAGYSSATASFVCQNNGEHTETLTDSQISYAVNNDGSTTYTASVTLGETPYTDTKTVEAAYYLVGTMNNWAPDDTYKFTLNPEASGEEYILSSTLTVGQELKVVKASNNYSDTWTWYPDLGGNYVVDADHAGAVTVYFSPNYKADWASFGGYIYIARDHSITVEVPDGYGTALASPTTASKETTITLMLTPEIGCEFDHVEFFRTNGGEAVTIAYNATNKTFAMPEYDVTVKVYFKPITWVFDTDAGDNGFTWTEDGEGGYNAVANYKSASNAAVTAALNVEVTSQTTPATCTTEGSTVYTAALEAGDSLDGEAHSGTKTVTIPALGHQLPLTHTESKAANCTEPGNIEYWYCSRCEKYFADADCTQEKTATDIEIPVDPDAHAYGAPTWTWAEDNTSATATFTCANNNEHTETRTVEGLVGVNGSGDDYGYIVYTATVTGPDNQTCTDVKRVARTAVAMIGETPYYTLQDAADAAVDGDTIVMVADVTITEQVTIRTYMYVNNVDVKRVITLDLNGKTISLTKDGELPKNALYVEGLTDTKGELIIDDTSTEQTGCIDASAISECYHTNGVSQGVAAVYVFGTTLTVNNGTLRGSSRSDSGASAIRSSQDYSSYNNVINIKGGTIDRMSVANSTVNISGGSIITELGTMAVSGGYIINMTGGEIVSNYQYAIFSGNCYKLNISGGNITSSGNGVYAQMISGGTAEISNGAIEAAGYALNVLGGAVSISGGTITSSGDYAVAADAADLTITGGTITNSSGDAIRIVNSSQNAMHTSISGGTIAGTGHAIYVNGYYGTDIEVAISGGTITGGGSTSDTLFYYNQNLSAVPYAVSGGIFDQEIAADYIVPGYECVPYEPIEGYYTVESVTYSTITFYDADGDVVAEKTVKNGTAWDDVEKPDAPDRLGYTFAGWANAPETVTADVTVTASYTVNTFTVEDITGAYTYTGVAQAPEVVVKDGEITLVKDTDYTVAYSDNINAGTATVTVTGMGNYAAMEPVEKTFNIGKASLTVTANAHTITYGDAPAANGVSCDGFVNGETEEVLGGAVTYTYTYTQYGDVGNYVITPAGLSSENYEMTFATGTLTVAAKEVVLTWTGTTFAYDGQDHVPTATATGLVNGDTVTVEVTGAASAAGTHTATAASLSSTNYKLPEANTTEFTIAPKDITGAEIALGAALTYTGSEQTQTITSVTVDGLTVTYTVSGNTGTNAGEYTLTVTATGNFTGTATKTFTISKADQPAPEVGHTDETVSGKSDGTITGLTTGMEYSTDGETYTAVTAETLTGLTSGTYYVRYAADANHNASNAAEVVITAGAKLTVTFDANGHGTAPAAQNVDYGAKAADPGVLTAEGYTFGGWYSEAACTTAYNFNTEVTENITLFAKWTANSFTVEDIAGTFTYTGQAQTPEVVVKDGETILVKDVDYTVSYSNNINAGTATVTVTGKGNYVVQEAVAKTFAIGKANLTVTANAKTITYGEAPANDGVSFEGFVNSETEAVLGGALTYTYTYEQYGNVGTYKIAPAGLTSENYNIIFADGDLAVEAKEVGLTWTDTTFAYDGQEHAPTATATGLVNNDEVTVTVTGAASAVGTHTATAASLSSANYKLPAANTTSFEITKGTQAAPTGVDKTDETISNKKDGTITGLTTAMEYSTDGETWVAITEEMLTDGTLADLAPWTYYVRFAETDNYNASEAVELVIEASATQLTVTWKVEGVADVTEGYDYGEIPAYKGTTPTKAADKDYTYTFAGWTDGTDTYAAGAALPAVTGEPTYTAVFTPADQVYTFTSFTWAEDYTATATLTAGEGGFTKTVAAEVTSKITTAATCETAGVRTYTATYGDQSDTKTETIPALTHDWNEPAYVWNEDHTSLTVTITCKNDTAHDHDWVRTFTGEEIESVTVAPTGTTEGSITYTVTFTFNGEEYEAKDVVTLSALGTYTVSGSIKSFTSNDKSEEAQVITVTLSQDGTVKYTAGNVSGEEAEFSIPSVEPGTYTLTVSKKDHAPRTYEVTVGTAPLNVEEIKIHLLGDINGDGKVNLSDAVAVNAHMNGTRLLTGYKLVCADIDQDGAVKAYDYGRIRAHAIKSSLIW